MDLSAFEWSDDLLLGVDLIDRQHQEYFSRVNQFLAACVLGNTASIRGTFGFLNEYVVFHFDAEQTVMAFHDYPDLEEHTALHEYFATEVAGLMDMASDSSLRDDFMPVLEDLLIRWFVDHIRQVDRKLADYLIPRL